MGFLCVLKMHHVRLYIMEKMGFGMASNRCGSHSKPQPLLQKTCLFHTSETLVAYAGMCMHTHALAHVHGPKATLVILFPIFFSHLKGYVFHFNTPQVNLISDWALNWPWALEFEHH